jgi:hypothetical protein
VGQKSLNFLLNQRQTDQFTAKNAGQKEDQKEISTDNSPQKPANGGFLSTLIRSLLNKNENRYGF